ncbi:hypothetical protein FRB94_002908 [Tulasnella sp. JGI-2019a]|nr:hypothetical protein FRB93_013928 [Tulasnella sp. JGI-2019a]KAG9013380.1 hypothetical protein FRB94_002908 [Tulasnella sp. JGI-2019a]KAG9033726.1 hypothetical protein FRB95_014413 [Tulasnella sp. JGI-2019a]
MADYDPDAGNPHAGWQMHSSGGSASSPTASSSRPPSSSTLSPDYDDDDNSLVLIPPNSAAFNMKRHQTAGNPLPKSDEVKKLGPWRMNENKLKTSQGILVVCLNIGVDPPDMVKTNPCAILECWIDPFSLPPSKALEHIGRNLRMQFESVNPRMKYKPELDPSVEETRKFCINLRKLCKDERALFYYNGHGVPKPTSSGEIWVFNKNYTQYIPVSLHDLQGWLGTPTMYIWDCSAAGHILENFDKFAKKRDQEFYTTHPDPATHATYSPFAESIHLAACAADETLPMAPELPADAFTSALTSPIEMALRFYVLQNQSRLNVTIDEAMKIPGDLKNRKTPLGELHWIFTAVTDTIAWTALPRDLFKLLFRQDWMLAAMFRNYLLAERILRRYNCTPKTTPALPPTYMHSLWSSWDLAVDKILVQLKVLLPFLENHTFEIEQPDLPYEGVAGTFFKDHLRAFEVWLNRGGSSVGSNRLTENPKLIIPPRIAESEIPLQHPTDIIASTTGRSRPVTRDARDRSLTHRDPPDQLPILLQVLLSIDHRVQALVLLSSFCDLGPWAVHLSLTIGIFPYVAKLLQSPSPSLRPVLIYIWSRILAFDQGCQVDLYRDPTGPDYFAKLLKDDVDLEVPNAGEHKAMCAFILSMVCRDYPPGQQQCFAIGLLNHAIATTRSDDYLMRQWGTLCMAILWDDFDEVKAHAIERLKVDTLLEALVFDDAAEVRAASFYAIGTLYGASSSSKDEKKGGGGIAGLVNLEERDHLGFELRFAMPIILPGKEDGSPMVRKEMLVVLSCLVREWRGWFVVAAWAYWEEHRIHTAKQNRASGAVREEDDDDLVANTIADWIERASPPDSEEIRGQTHAWFQSFFNLYAVILNLTMDPYPEVATYAQTIADYVLALLLESPFAKLANSSLHSAPMPRVPPSNQPPSRNVATQPRTRVASLQGLQGLQGFTQVKNSVPLSRTDTMDSNLTNGTATALSSTIKRTSSFATSLKNLATGYAFPAVAEKEKGEVVPETTEQPTAHPPRPEFHASVPQPRLSIAKYRSPYCVEDEETSDEAAASGMKSPIPSIRSEPYAARDRRSIASSISAPSTPSARRQGGFHFPSSGTATPTSFDDSSSIPSFPSFSATDVVEALIEEDWERLRARRRAANRVREDQRKAIERERRANGLKEIEKTRQEQIHMQGQPGRPPGQPGVVQVPQVPAQAPPPQAVGATATPMYMRGNSALPAVNGHVAAVGQHPPPHSQQSAHPHAESGHNSQPTWSSSPSSSFATMDSDGPAAPMGIGTGATLQNVLPLKSTYFDWSVEYFFEPQMRLSEADEPGSVVWNEQTWRGSRNEQIRYTTHKQGLTANRGSWDRSLVTLNTVHPVVEMRFHQYETHLAMTNAENLVSVWDWSKKKRIACFDNGNPTGTSVTSLTFINEDMQAQIMTASSDGVVRIYRNYDPDTAFDDYPIELSTAWRALPELVISKRRGGVVTDWLQPYGILVVGGDSRVIKIWDCHKEMSMANIETDSTSCVTSIASDLDGATTVLAGNAEGEIKVYDRRTSGSQMMVKDYRQHSSWIQNLHWQRGADREIVSASVDGDVHLWDIRSATGSVMDWRPHPNGLASMAVHDHTGVFATTSAITASSWRQQTVVVQPLPPHNSTPCITRVDFNTGLHYPPPRSSSLTSKYFSSPNALAFHPHEMMYAYGGPDGKVKLMSCNLKDLEARMRMPFDLPVPGGMGMVMNGGMPSTPLAG